MKKLSLILILSGAFFVTKAQTFQDAQKRTETFNSDDALVRTVDMDLTNGLAQIGYLRPEVNSLVNTPSNSNSATRIHFTHLNDFNSPTTVINKLIMPSTENPYYMDNNKKYYPKEIHKINAGYVVCGYYEDVATCNPSAAKSAFIMTMDNFGVPINYKSYTITSNTTDYIMLNSIAPVNDGAVVHGFVACGYKWDNTNQRTKAIILVVDEGLNLLNTKEINEAAIYVSELNANVYPSSYYNKIDRYTDDELFLIGSVGVVSVTEGSLPDGKAYLRGDVLFARCSTNVTTRPSTPLIVTAVNLFSNYTDVAELGVALVPMDHNQTGSTYALLIDRVEDQFSGSQFVSRNSSILLHAIGSVHTVNHSLWAYGGMAGRIDYQNTSYERGKDIILDDSNYLYILCSYDGFKKPIESRIYISGGNASTPRGNDYMGALGGDLLPYDYDNDGTNGRKILAPYEVSPRTEKINILGYTTDPSNAQCKGFEHYVANYSYSMNKGTSKTYQTPSITACSVQMTAYNIPINVQDPCPPPLRKQDPNTNQQQNSIPDNDIAPNTNNKNQTGVKVYPNPAATAVTFEFTEAIASTSKLEVIAASGQVVITLDNAGTKTNGNAVAIDISTLADGVYFCKVTGTNGKQLQTRFTKTSLK
jgi:hypothetical protein